MTLTAINTAPEDGAPWLQIVRASALPLGLILIWQAWAMTLPANSPAPAPLKVVTTAVDLIANGGLLMALVQSLGRVALGFCIALVLGVVLGILMGSSRAVRENLDPIFESFRPIAPMAILPIAILWFGTGTPSALAIVSYAAFFPMLLNTVHGVSRVDRKLVLAAQTMGIPRLTILQRVVLPGSMPSILLGSRLAMGVAWTAIIAAELAVGAGHRQLRRVLSDAAERRVEEAAQRRQRQTANTRHEGPPDKPFHARRRGL